MIGELQINTTASDDAVQDGGMYYIWSKVQDSRFESEMKGTVCLQH